MIEKLVDKGNRGHPAPSSRRPAGDGNGGPPGEASSDTGCGARGSRKIFRDQRGE